jgi:hypothetical protein
MERDADEPELPVGRHVPVHRTRLAQLVDEAHLTRDDAVAKFDQAARVLNERVSVSPRQFARWMAGDGAPRPAACRILEQLFKSSIAELLGPPTPALRAEPGRMHEPAPRRPDDAGERTYADLDDMNQRVQSLLATADDAPVSPELLEEAVEIKARAAVEMPPRAMIFDLAKYLDQVYQALRNPAVGNTDRRRLMRVGGLFSVLLAEEFMVVGQEPRSRRWFNAADQFALAAGDLAVRSLAVSLRSRLPLYFGEVAESVEIARLAQDIAPPNHLALTLAPMAEALALAQLGDRSGSIVALGVARASFEHLDSRFLQNTVFGFSPRRFAFYESRVLLDAGDLSAAWESQDETLKLYPPAMVGDVVMIHLDRARLLVMLGEVQGGCEHAADALLSMPVEQRADIFRSRAWRLLAAVPRSARTLTAVVELRDALAEVSYES